MRIHQQSDIDLNKLSKLFRERGHGILADGMVETLFEVLEGKLKGFSALQCKCGELMLFQDKIAEDLAKRIEVSVEDLPCRHCGRYKEAMVDFELIHALDNFIEMKGVDAKTMYEKNPITDFIPLTSEEEAALGFFQLVEALKSSFPPAMSNTEQFVRSLAVAAFARNRAGYVALVQQIVDFGKLSSKTRNYIKASLISSGIKGEALRKRLFGEYVDETSYEEQVFRALHSAYLEAAEETEHLDVLENLRRISLGLNPLHQPLLGQSLPPKRKGDKQRKVESLADRVEFIDLALPGLKIRDFYNSHLRNSKGHNEYEIDARKREILLTKYHETVTFDRLRTMLNGITAMFSGIDGFILEKRVSELQGKNLLGIAGVILGYDVPALVGENLVPVGESLPELMIYQLWCFSSTDLSSHLVPSMSVDSEKLTVRITRGYKVSYPRNEVTERWIKQVILKGGVKVEIFTLFPPLPLFLSEARYLVRFGKDKRSEAYITPAAQVTVTLSGEVLTEISKSLNFVRDSKEAGELAEEARRLQVVMESGLDTVTVRRVVELQKQGFDTHLIQAVWTRLGFLPLPDMPAGVIYDVLPQDLPQVVSDVKAIKGGDSEIRYWVKEGLVLSTVEVLNSVNHQAIVFMFHFGKAYLDVLQREGDDLLLR